MKYIDEPHKALHIAVNMLGSDTDTIASFVGGLFGAFYGRQVIKSNLLDELQDKDYILNVANRLYDIASGGALKRCLSTQKLERRDYPLLIQAWRIGFSEMFWDALKEGGTVMHPILGNGRIVRKEVKPLFREDYVIKLIEVNFSCGQSCVFHSRVKRELCSILKGEFPGEESMEERLEQLVEKGLIRSSGGKFKDFSPLKISGRSLSEILNEIRGNPNG